MKHIPLLQKRRAAALRRTPTEAEARLWSHLRGRQLGGHKFSRQIAIGPYIADFVCRECRLVIELDGGQHGDAADQRRQAQIEALGYRVLRFWNNAALANSEGMLRTILDALGGDVRGSDGGCPPPGPLPVGEGGKS